MGSKRLPNKALRKIAGKTVAERIIERLQRAKGIDEIVLATTDQSKDDVLTKIAKKSGIQYFRGSEDDVLGRLYGAARAFNADAVLRITGDSPLADPCVIDAAIQEYRKRYPKIRFLSAALPFTLPEGFSMEIISQDILKAADAVLKKMSDRETFVIYLTKHRNKFPRFNFTYWKDASNFRLTLDYPEDMKVIRKIYSHFFKVGKKDFTLDDIVEYLDAHQAIAAINQFRMDKEKYPFSLSRAAVLKAL